MSNYVRMPVRFIPANQELLKSQEGPGWAGQRKGTDWHPDEVAAMQVPGGVVQQYRAPAGRASGNMLFRRHLSGELDLEYAKHVVIEALHRARDSAGVDQLNSLEKAALSVLFPMSFDFVATGMLPAVASVQLRLSPVEIQQIREMVAQHLAEVANWNAGMGGGSVPGRSSSQV